MTFYGEQQQPIDNVVEGIETQPSLKTRNRSYRTEGQETWYIDGNASDGGSGAPSQGIQTSFARIRIGQLSSKIASRRMSTQLCLLWVHRDSEEAKFVPR